MSDGQGLNYADTMTMVGSYNDLLSKQIAENRELRKRVALLETALGLRDSPEVCVDKWSLDQIEEILVRAQTGINACRSILSSAGLANTPTFTSLKWAHHYAEAVVDVFKTNKESLWLALQAPDGIEEV